MGARATAGQDGKGAGVRRRGPLRRLARWLGVAVVLGAAVFFGGFLWFADEVSSMTPPLGARADAIVVLTGGSQRLDQAVELLSSGAGKRLLISGVHPLTTATRIRTLTQGSRQLFDCCVDIGYEALDTIGNAKETVAWLTSHKFRSVLVVTNNYHMPRSLLELRRAGPGIAFTAWPVVNADLKTRNWMADPKVIKVLLSEYAKLIAASVRGLTGIGDRSGLRSHGDASEANSG